jgi:hypothetical protein
LRRENLFHRLSKKNPLMLRSFERDHKFGHASRHAANQT